MTEKFIQMSLDNLELCIDLYIKVFNSVPWSEHWSYETVQERLTDLVNTPKFQGFLLLADNNVIGFIAGHSKRSDQGKIFYLAELCISKEIQGKGYGSKLLSFLEEVLIKENVKSVYLLTSTGGSAEAFYKNNHYDVNENRTVMKKDLR
ncbi:Acetyltransferase (GNAT) domain-containing protein [Desulfotomaculum arcticum]|uniref:Acetyltransferase (GNAT) domain-containing protein n=1 Tax=Desulfotruncus arcticus DSM 17038 TaxID=1121424 RepID=A0A1I2P751_9FIRM|nr:GNAT family N-acetyltransferase [Desulfotruncus arcticus]SFG09466.1 Acetyltransferase (GNAT) domain-containing protein [Desulfotomaculum arcticum] [Desulfotruncus arcticus DSM 17038]